MLGADPVDPEVTAALRAEAHINIGTPVGYFLAKAADAETAYVRAYWLRRVDGARHMAERQAVRDMLDRRTRENLEAEARLVATEATLEIVRTVGNAVVLKAVPGEKRPPGGYSLVRRLAGETGTEDYGPPRADHWTVQGLRMNAVHECAVVSKDDLSAKDVLGPWLAVPIGDVSAAELQEREQAEAARQYREHEAAEREKERRHAAEADQRRQDRAEALAEQQRQADADNARRERERIEREEAHRKAVEELPLVRPRDVGVRLRGLPDGRILADLEWTRGKKRCQFYRVELGGTVLGDDPGGRWSGAKSENHRYTRTLEIPKGRKVEIVIAGVTKHGDGEIRIPIDVPESLCEPAGDDEAPSRMDRIVAAARSYTGRRTRDGRPWVRYLRRHANMPDITTKERDEAHRLLA